MNSEPLTKDDAKAFRKDLKADLAKMKRDILLCWAIGCLFLLAMVLLTPILLRH